MRNRPTHGGGEITGRQVYTVRALTRIRSSCARQGTVSMLESFVGSLATYSLCRARHWLAPRPGKLRLTWRK